MHITNDHTRRAVRVAAAVAAAGFAALTMAGCTTAERLPVKFDGAGSYSHIDR